MIENLLHALFSAIGKIVEALTPEPSPRRRPRRPQPRRPRPQGRWAWDDDRQDWVPVTD